MKDEERAFEWCKKAAGQGKAHLQSVTRLTTLKMMLIGNCGF